MQKKIMANFVFGSKLFHTLMIHSGKKSLSKCYNKSWVWDFISLYAPCYCSPVQCFYDNNLTTLTLTLYQDCRKIIF